MPQNKLSSLKAPMNVSAANASLDSLSLDHLRGSDQEQLSKFLHLCQHWQIFAKEEVDRRAAASTWAKRELKSLKSRNREG
jgi:hypothetical protein